MKAAVFHKPKDVRYETFPDPVIERPDDAIIRVTSTAICGSDLHIYNGFFPQLQYLVLGHEFMGIVEDVGNEIQNLKRGDRVIVPFAIACGKCWFCSHGLQAHCEKSNTENYGPEGHLLEGKGGGLFGYTDLYGGYDGGQAEYVRVPFANYGPRKIPANVSDEQALFLTDIFPTGYSAVEWAGITGGETVAVFGCGPVGLMAQKAAWLKGASRVIGIDVEQYRLEAANKYCQSETMNAKDPHIIERLRDATDGRGPDACIDAVGMEADHNFWDTVKTVIRLEKGYIHGLRMAIDAVRRGGVVSVVGVYGYAYDNFPLHQIFDKGLTIRMGQTPVHKYLDELLPLVIDKKVILDDIISHRLPLSEASHAYKIFNEKKDSCIKVVLQP